jgi:hypothetical protein
MAGLLWLRESQWKDLAIVRDRLPLCVDVLITRLDVASPPPLTRADLERIFKESMPDVDSALALSRTTFALTNLLDRLELRPETILEDLRGSLPSEWTDGERGRWSSVEPAFRRLLDSTVIRRVARSEDLSRDYANILQSTRVITDLRPVFTDDGGDIEGAIVSFTLRIGYFQDEATRSISLAMDRKDVERLGQQCQRAVIEANTMERRFSHPGGGTSIRMIGQGES